MTKSDIIAEALFEALASAGDNELALLRAAIEDFKEARKHSYNSVKQGGAFGRNMLDAMEEACSYRDCASASVQQFHVISQGGQIVHSTHSSLKDALNAAQDGQHVGELEQAGQHPKNDEFAGYKQIWDSTGKDVSADWD